MKNKSSKKLELDFIRNFIQVKIRITKLKILWVKREFFEKKPLNSQKIALITVNGAVRAVLTNYA
jgi:hypothetical protein